MEVLQFQAYLSMQKQCSERNKWYLIPLGKTNKENEWSEVFQEFQVWIVILRKKKQLMYHLVIKHGLLENSSVDDVPIETSMKFM